MGALLPDMYVQEDKVYPPRKGAQGGSECALLKVAEWKTELIHGTESTGKLSNTNHPAQGKEVPFGFFTSDMKMSWPDPR